MHALILMFVLNNHRRGPVHTNWRSQWTRSDSESACVAYIMEVNLSESPAGGSPGGPIL